MYHIEYQVKDSSDTVKISTTRPETMFADKVAFVNPKDARHTNLIGKTIINPANGAEMTVMADKYVSIEKGTGVMKCTPAHDFNDYELGIKHNLEFISIMNEDGTLNELAGDLAGVDRLEARKLLVKRFEEAGILEKEEHVGLVHISDRSGTPVEPMLSLQ